MTVLDLKEMLTYRRPHRSRSERKFINRFIRPVIAKHDSEEDSFGNLICTVGGDRRMLWASHTDTVHSKGGRQRVFAGTDGVLRTDRFEDCLGADDTTGVWLMLNLIQQGMPGLYVFHRAEEIGCHGSRWIVDNTPGLVDDTLWCVSLDRRGYGSLVTHQCGLRTASDTFAKGLAMQLDLGYTPDSGGLFTDSLEYAWRVPECSNLSVGYDNPHRGSESQDFGYALALLRSLLSLDYDFLPVERDPDLQADEYDEDEEDKYRTGSSSGNAWGYSFDDYDHHDWKNRYGSIEWEAV